MGNGFWCPVEGGIWVLGPQSVPRKENRICINSLATGDVVLTSCGVKCAVGTQEARRRFLLSVEGMRTEETLKPGLCGRQGCDPPDDVHVLSAAPVTCHLTWQRAHCRCD